MMKHLVKQRLEESQLQTEEHQPVIFAKPGFRQRPSMRKSKSGFVGLGLDRQNTKKITRQTVEVNE
jgi:hypothetical protein